MQRHAAADTSNESTIAAAASVTPASTEPLPVVVAAAAATSSRGSTSINNPMPLSSSAATDTASRSETAACNSCVRLLQHVLSDPESKPARLLHSMMNTSSNVSSRTTNRQPQHELLFQATPDGARVQIPVETTPFSSSSDQGATLAALQQSAPFVAPETVTAEPLLRRFTRLGWSATTTTSSSNNCNSSTTAFSPDLQSPTGATIGTPLLATSASRRQPQPPKTEWMSLQCRTCADTGPEGNARAFVMGPTPLSIVVCHNRLVSAAATSPAAPTTPFSSSFRPSKTATTTTTAATLTNPAAISEMEEILTHELTHIYDVRQLHLNLQSCHDLAYSEVRAAREAECAHLATCSTSAFSAPSVLLFGAAASKGNSNTNASTSSWNPQKECVRNIATTATRNLFARNRANRCVQDVLDRAYADQRPFMATSTSGSGNATSTADTSSVPTSSTMASNTSATTPITADRSMDPFAAPTKQRQPLNVVSEQ